MGTWKHLGSRRGQAIVELLIAFPVLALLLFGIVEMGAAWRTYHVVTQAAREGSRLAALAGATEEGVQATIENRLTSGGLDAGEAAIDFECDGDCFQVGRPSGLTVETQVSYPFEFVLLAPIANYVSGDGAAYGAGTLQSSFAMRTE